MRKKYKKKFRIPGHNQNFIPNGLEFCPDMDIYLISGYMRDSRAARIYVIDSDGKYRCKDIFISKKKEMKCHFCGVARFENYIYITCCDGSCYVMKLSELLRRDTSAANIMASFKTDNRASFCCVYNGFLYIGEHNHKGRKNTASNMYTPGGEHNNALICAFRLNEAINIGVSKHCEFAFSIKGKVKGMSFSDEGQIILLVSKQIKCSYLFIYDCETAFQIVKNELPVLGRTVTVYYLDKLSQISVRRCMPGTQDIVLNKKTMYTISTNEKLPVIGRLTGADYLKFGTFVIKV